ncbi:MAG: DUF4186 family protein [Desulfosarcina sp.]
MQGKGIETIRSHIIDFITTRLAPAFPKNDGKQTPMKGHPIFIAQHATATCCRGCLWKWNRIEKGRSLTDDGIGFVVELMMGWIEKLFSTTRMSGKLAIYGWATVDCIDSNRISNLQPQYRPKQTGRLICGKKC